jgi:hypothetical protein
MALGMVANSDTSEDVATTATRPALSVMVDINMPSSVRHELDDSAHRRVQLEVCRTLCLPPVFIEEAIDDWCS